MFQVLTRPRHKAFFHRDTAKHPWCQRVSECFPHRHKTEQDANAGRCLPLRQNLPSISGTKRPSIFLRSDWISFWTLGKARSLGRIPKRRRWMQIERLKYWVAARPGKGATTMRARTWQSPGTHKTGLAEP